MAPEKWNAVAAIGSAASAVAALFSVCLVVFFGHEQSVISRETELAQTEQHYTDEYEKVFSKNNENPFLIRGYIKLSDSDRSAVQIVAGLMVQVVDNMAEAHDPRMKAWLTYLAGYSGPLFCGYPLSDFAREPATKSAIAHASEAAKHEAALAGLTATACGGRQ